MAIVNNFQEKSLKDSLQRIRVAGIINDEQASILEEYYKNDPRNYSEISRELFKIEGRDNQLLKKILKNAVENQKDISLDKIEEKKEEKVELSLEHITDFEKEGKSYIKIHYPYPFDEIKIVQNMTNPHKSGKELFEMYNGTQNIISVDGITNATSIFEQSLMRDCIEVKMQNAQNFTSVDEIKKLTKEQLIIVTGTIRTLVQALPLPVEERKKILNQPIKTILEILNKKIWISPENNIITICDSNTHEKDMVDTLKVEEYQTLDGIKRNYKLEPLDSKSYSYNSSEKEEEDTSLENTGTNTEYEKSNNDPIETSYAYIKRKNNNRKKRQEAAFVSILSLMIIGSVILGIISASLIKLYIK